MDEGSCVEVEREVDGLPAYNCVCKDGYENKGSFPGLDMSMNPCVLIIPCERVKCVHPRTCTNWPFVLNADFTYYRTYYKCGSELAGKFSCDYGWTGDLCDAAVKGLAVTMNGAPRRGL